MYLWIKALHVIAIISWMAGLLYLPRLFVYHCEATVTGIGDIFKVMERRLLIIIITPAAVLAWVTGLTLLAYGDFWRDMWIHLKIALALCLTFINIYFSYLVWVFARDANRHSQRFFRTINEIPTVLMIAIVVLVVVKPFAG